MRILGLDIGSTSIKAVEIDSSFGRYQIHDYHTHKLDSSQDITQSLKLFLGSISKVPDKVVVGFATGLSSFRTLNLPVKDRRSITSGVAFELEDDLPFDMDVVQYDFSTVFQQGNQTEVHVGYTLSKNIETYLETVQPGGLDPDIITSEAWALRCFLNKYISDEDKNKITFLVHMGHQKTLFYAQINGKPLFIREIKWGGHDLTSAICKQYGIPIEQAEKTKLEHGFVLSPTKKSEATPDQVAFSDTLMEPLAELLTELRKAILSAKSLGHVSIGKFLISGGPSKLPGLLAVLEEELQIKTDNIKSLSTISNTEIQYPIDAEQDFTLAAAFAMTPVNSEKGNLLNFRKGPFAKQGTHGQINFQSLKGPLRQTGVVLGCLLISIVFQNYMYKDRIIKANNNLEKNIRQFFPAVSNSAVKSYLSNTTLLKNEIQKELTKQRELAALAQPNPYSPLDFLKSLSSTVSKSVTVDLIEMKAGANPKTAYSTTAPTQTSLTFIVPEQKYVDQIISTLSSRLTGLEKTTPQETVYPENTDGKTKKLQFNIKGNLNEKAYGR